MAITHGNQSDPLLAIKIFSEGHDRAGHSIGADGPPPATNAIADQRDCRSTYEFSSLEQI
jgi:hypothetical protein